MDLSFDGRWYDSSGALPSLDLDLGLFAGFFWLILLEFGLEASLGSRWAFCGSWLFFGHHRGPERRYAF